MAHVMVMVHREACIGTTRIQSTQTCYIGRSRALIIVVWCSDNYAGGLGAAVLANALQKNTALLELYIKGNDMGNEGIKALCGALAERETSFRVLDVGNNRQATLTCSSHLPCMPRLCCFARIHGRSVLQQSNNEVSNRQTEM